MNRRGNAGRSDRRWRLACVVGACGALGLLAVACGPDVWGDSAVKPLEPPRPEEVKHQRCDDSVGQMQAITSSAGAHATVSRAVDPSGKEVCRVVDFDQNGKPDLYQYFDAQGALVRQEMAYDGSGNITAVEFYEAGRLVRRELDLSGGHRIDTWEYFEKDAVPDPKTGKLRPSRVERDTRGTGHVNEWWTWSGDKLTIVKDVKGDGKPDPSTTIVVGGPTEAPSAQALKGDGGAISDGSVPDGSPSIESVAPPTPGDAAMDGPPSGPTAPTPAHTPDAAVSPAKRGT